MAVTGQRKHVLVVMEDKRMDYFVYSIGIKHLFEPGAGGSAMEMRSLPSPMGKIDKPFAYPECFDFALAGDGATLVGISGRKRTVLYDTRSGKSSTGPELQYSKPNGTHVIPMGPRFYVLERRLTGYEQGNPTGEDCAIFLPAAGLRRASSSWRALPEPPADFRCLNDFQITCDLAAYVTAGARIWVSARDRGTYTFDTASRAWRKEGDWELPFHNRALFLPELDNLCFGLCSKTRHLVAVDIRQSPPVVRYSLVYLGDGKFCIAWSGFMDDVDGHREHFIQLIAVQLVKTSILSGDKKLRMVNLKGCCYKMPTDGRMARAF
ncbi:unnamed protein product [Alopecurus aequalis]